VNRFEEKTVIVTGAGSGIGLEMARLFLSEGARVFAGDLDVAKVPAEAVGVVTDVTQEDSVRALVDAAVGATGRLDVLCSNAGRGSTKDPVSCSAEEWDAVFAVNCRGVFLGAKYALPHMLARGRGVIVNTASAAGLIGLPDRAAYCASKGAVISFTKQVAIQYATKGVRCNCICPGTVDSPWVARLLEEAGDPRAARAALIARQPLGRLATPTEVAKAALYLASDDAAFVTGSSLVIDGGILAG
jgi:NAD(P)-dependent dehydrogenase (short-subunit alcohol dehydrogenase family)